MGIGGCLYAVGGMDSPKAGHWGLPLKTVERYDPDLDVWTEVASMNEARFGCAVAAYQVSTYSRLLNKQHCMLIMFWTFCPFSKPLFGNIYINSLVNLIFLRYFH